MAQTIIILIVLVVIGEILNTPKNKEKINDIRYKGNNDVTIYELKPIMSDYEYKFYKILEELKNEYEILPQVNLASIVNKINNNKYHNELFRNIDFAIFSKDYEELLLLIEINDKTHNQQKRKDRDLKVKKICNDINVKLIKFYTYYPNEKEYVINRIKKELEYEIEDNY